MANNLVHIENPETGVSETREMTESEQAAFTLHLQGIAEKEKVKAKEALVAAEAKTAAEAKLAALGLTADDLKALGLGNN